MSMIRRWRRLSMRLLNVSCLAAGLAFVPALAWSQAPAVPAAPVAADKAPSRFFSKNQTFHLPVQMTPAMRADTREICLYVKQNAGDWVRQETAPPNTTHFTPRVSKDGEYWFSLVTVSKSGKQTPADVAKAPPGLRVVVDTTAPGIDVQPGSTPEGDFCIRCIVAEPNFDQATLRAVSLTDLGERPLEAVPTMNGAFRLKSPELLNFPVRVSASDMAGNIAAKEVNIRDMVSSALKVPEKLNPAFHTEGPASTAPLSSPVLASSIPALPAPPPPLPGPGVPPAPLSAVTSTPLNPTVNPPVNPTRPATEAVLPASVNPPALVNPPAAPTQTTPGNAAKQILNTTTATIDYRLDQVGPSGVGKVDVYMTADTGSNWKKICEDHDRRTPVELELPGEGLFGLKLVVTNGNGFGGTPPAPGEQPAFWIEVDTTNPIVQMRPIEPMTLNGILELHWSATDAHLGAEPVTLYFRTQSDGPWQVIARNVKNEGAYRWTFPRDVGGQFWFKVEVADTAGNTARAETTIPLMLDMSEPRASVVSITGTSAVRQTSGSK